MNRDAQAVELLQPYDPKSQGWTRRDATHLLWRVQFGATLSEIDRVTDEGLEKTLDRFLTPQPESADFVSSDSLLRQAALDTGNIQYLKSWWLSRMLNSANPLVERMALLWHNHFATSNTKVRSVEHMAAQNDLIRSQALGNFRQLLSGMARDVAMLIWLDGNANRKRNANENFAREVMELFSLGVGNYTEQDIVEAARAFTGWHIRDEKFWFNKRQHDYQEKKVLGHTGNLDGDDVIDICLDQASCPRFLASKLLAEFVAPENDPGVVELLASRIGAHNFQMTPVMRELFNSRLFFRAQSRHSIIKSPINLVLGAHRSLGAEANLQTIARILADLGQDLFQPPTVKGWEGGRRWISTTSMLKRANFAARVTSASPLSAIDDPGPFEQVGKLNDPEKVARHYSELLLASEIDTKSSARLASYLRENHEDRGLRIRGLVHLIMATPQYQLH